MTNNTGKFDDSLFKKYLEIIKEPAGQPDKEMLKALIAGHLAYIPFENISKLYYNKKHGNNSIPAFEKYIQDISEYQFGGTCYANNYYFSRLLDYLGYNVKLCGADKTKPDVHVVSIVTIDNLEYIVDAGYAAPFFEPMPRYLTTDYEINFGEDKYVLLPKDANGYSQLQHYKNGSLVHGYAVNPKARDISEFEPVIKASYSEKSSFMNSIMLVKYGKNCSNVIRNFSSIEFQNNSYKKKKLQDKDALAGEIENIFGIPEKVSREVLEYLSIYFDSWK